MENDRIIKAVFRYKGGLCSIKAEYKDKTTREKIVPKITQNMKHTDTKDAVSIYVGATQ